MLKTISRPDLKSFIINATHLAKDVEAEISDENYENPPASYNEILERINKAGAFLRKAHEAGIINVEYMKVKDWVLHGVKLIDAGDREGIYRIPNWGRDGLASRGQFFVPDRELKQHESLILKDPRKIFADAVRHVKNMAVAIEHKADKPESNDRRISRPYGITDGSWQPAKLVV